MDRQVDPDSLLKMANWSSNLVIVCTFSSTLAGPVGTVMAYHRCHRGCHHVGDDVSLQPLRRFELPLQPDQVPSGYGWDGRAMSTRSTTSAFRTVVPTRDTFLGRPSCVVCGGHISTNSCHIIPQSETDTVSSKIHHKLIALILIWTAVDQSQANGMDPWRG